MGRRRGRPRGARLPAPTVGTMQATRKVVNGYVTAAKGKVSPEQLVELIRAVRAALA